MGCGPVFSTTHLQTAATAELGVPRLIRSRLKFGLLLPSLLCLVLELGLLSGYLGGLHGSTLLGHAACFGGGCDVILALLLLIHVGLLVEHPLYAYQPRLPTKSLSVRVLLLCRVQGSGM